MNRTEDPCNASVRARQKVRGGTCNLTQAPGTLVSSGGKAWRQRAGEKEPFAGTNFTAGLREAGDVLGTSGSGKGRGTPTAGNARGGTSAGWGADSMSSREDCILGGIDYRDSLFSAGL